MLYTPCLHYLQKLKFFNSSRNTRNLYKTDSNNDCEILGYRETIIINLKRVYRVELGQGKLKLGFFFNLILHSLICLDMV